MVASTRAEATTLLDHYAVQVDAFPQGTQRERETRDGLRERVRVARVQLVTLQGDVVKMPHDERDMYDQRNRIARQQSQQGKEHPVAFPVSIPARCIYAASSPEDSVLDPFMGSGTTGVACANLGRRFIGIENNPTYFDIACERIRQAQRQGRMFE
jgi:DNA modification methylase